MLVIHRGARSMRWVVGYNRYHPRAERYHPWTCVSTRQYQRTLSEHLVGDKPTSRKAGTSDVPTRRLRCQGRDYEHAEALHGRRRICTRHGYEPP